MSRSRLRGALLTGVVIVLLAGLAVALPSVEPERATARSPRPNIVFVLTDDLTWNLVRYLPQVQRLRQEGMTFTDYVVTDSLCCPSRASILTGRFPHNTGVYRNGGRDGGFAKFHSSGQEADTFATAVQRRGYRTAFMGKYLNGYQPDHIGDGTRPYVPPGWDEWAVTGGGYSGFNYTLNQNHELERYGRKPSDYLTDVLADKGADFIERTADRHRPFLLEISTFAPHAPFTPAPRDSGEFAGLTAPRGPGYNVAVTNPPRWLARAGNTALSTKEQREIDTVFRKRARAVQAVDDLVATLRRAVTEARVAADTYFVFSSDNGYHMGEHRLRPGKMTAFDTDIRVPLVVAGPGVPAGVSSDAAVANVDLAPTFEQLAGAPVRDTVDGRSLVSLMHGGSDASWRTGNLIEHHGQTTRGGDPDRPTAGSGNPPTYQALRTHAYTYVAYADGSEEYYDLVHDPFQMHNIAATLGPDRRGQLRAALQRLATCRDGATCWAAGHV